MQVPAFEPIGYLQSCFVEKFGTPRQAGMIPAAQGVLKLKPDPAFRDALRHLDSFSHVWLIFHFHDLADPSWKPLISPPRIDAPNRVGVFASRSPHRPNALGLSAVKLERIDFDARGGIEIHLSGVDIIDGTPVYDLKPYVPYVDCIPQARPGWTDTQIPKFEVTFSEESLLQLREAETHHAGNLNLEALLIQTLEYDPRPTSQRKAIPLGDAKSEGLTFAFRILNLDVHWRIHEGGLRVEQITEA
ncbi:MAG: tRNA (N6-threonylcarbamoyladenosine(37)-N6)-methyltransferase TrmO [Bdellovibrionales bacterium]|nr:tRNA (N6-threonylcarbamoyladenosine(37)-N6)-methyltransferase TrmO [Oligoflexia bacterium]